MKYVSSEILYFWFLYLCSAGGPWLVTDMRRGENMLELDPAAQEEVDRGIENDGSNLSGVSARCSWSELNSVVTGGELVIALSFCM